MKPSKLAGLVLQNAHRNRREFLLAGFGIVVGIAAFVLILGFSMGVRNKVLDVFPLERVEVIAPKASMLGVDMTKRLDDSTVAAIEGQKQFPVASTVPRMAITFPIAVSGYFDGARLVMDFVGDGVDPEFIKGDSKIGDMFRDWEADDTELKSCKLPQLTCDGLYYCDTTDMKCHHRVPVVVSRNLIEIYNNQFAKSRGLPMIGAMEEFIVQRGGLSKMRLYIDLGESAVSMNRKPLNSKPRRIEGVLLGISDRAIPIGATVPIQYVRRWNQEYVGEEAATAYSSIIVTLKKKDDVAPFGKWLVDEHDLRIEDSLGERLAVIITIVTLLFLVIALVIVVISAINIAHSFFMQVSERRREIGLLRAIGATQGDIRSLFVWEAAFLGFAAGILGIGVGIGLAQVADFVLAQLPDFAFKPKTFFDFQWWIPTSGLGVAVLFAVLGGALPARKAAKMQPAQALASQ